MILTVVVEPQIAKLRKKSATTIVTMLVRIAVPTARPTPAGPPEAVFEAPEHPRLRRFLSQVL